jgi:hypothetical protein
MARVIAKVKARWARQILDEVEARGYFAKDQHGLTDARLIQQLWNEFSGEAEGGKGADEVIVRVAGRATIALYRSDYLLALARIAQGKESVR